MFNVCPGCGQLSDAKRVDLARGAAVCAACGHAHRFKRLPLFVITGASCTGKTTVGLVLPDRLPECVCLDSDILWREEFNHAQGNYLEFRNLWLRVAKNIAQSGRSLLLLGSAVPEQFEACPERRYIGDIHYLAFVCSKEELARRLRARPDWRNSGSDAQVQKMIEFNDWLIERGDQQHITLVDTTHIGVEETVGETVRWYHERAGQSTSHRNFAAEQIVVVDYDESWPLIFEAMLQPIRRTLAEICLTIEHVGSTAVPGLAAKPIIDMDVVVASEELVQEAIDRLASLGYKHLGDRGIPGREAFAHPPHKPAHHLYVLTKDAVELKKHLMVRDRLRTDRHAATAYGQLKRDLAQRYRDDREGYTEAKTEFIAKLLEEAQYGRAKS